MVECLLERLFVYMVSVQCMDFISMVDDSLGYGKVHGAVKISVGIDPGSSQNANE